MTYEQAKALGRRALAAGFPLEPIDHALYLDSLQGEEFTFRGVHTLPCTYVPTPDFRDAATLGILEAQALQRLDNECLYVRPSYWGSSWDIYDRDDLEHEGNGEHRAYAWVAALEAAPTP